MTKRQAILAVALGTSVLSLLGPAAAFAQQANFPTRSRNYRAPVVRAFDACTGPTVVVTDPNLPLLGCAAANTTTDSVLTMRKAKLLIRPNGKISVSGAGFTVGDALRVRLTLRVTRAMVDTTAGSDKTVTFSDVTVDCPQSPDAVAVRLNGSVHRSIQLGACLSPTFGLAEGNIEVLSASLVNIDSGLDVGVPGLVIH